MQKKIQDDDKQKTYVINRKGEREEVSFDKVLKRIQTLSIGLNVNSHIVAQETIQNIINDIQTTEIDKISSQIAASYSTNDTDYDQLAVKILISNDHKEQKDKFVTQMKKFYQNGQLSEEFMDIVNEYGHKVEKFIDHNRDYYYDIFGLHTLKKTYLLRTFIDNKEYKEKIQHMFMRFAIALHNKNIKNIKDTYNALSKKYISCPTPQYCNAGTKRQQFASCFLLGTEDSIDGMYESIKDIALISKDMGGIGLHASNVRPRGSIINSTGMLSTGLIRYLKVLDSASMHVTQGGRRSMSCAIYIEPWHEEFLDFLKMCLNNGQEQDRCRELFTAIFINDIFMKRLQQRLKTKKPVMWTFLNQSKYPKLQDLYGDEFEQYYLQSEQKQTQFCTQNNLKLSQIDISELYSQIVKSQVETGRPYITFKDNINNKCNQNFIGTIKSSNLCVSPDTKILTDQGYQQISKLKDKKVNVWNGFEFSNTTVRQTGTSKKLIKIEFIHGQQLVCTPYHKFHIETYSKPFEKSRPKIVEAKDLELGMKIVKHNLPTTNNSTQQLQQAYTNGLFTADGTWNFVPCLNKSSEQRQCSYSKHGITQFCKKHQNQILTYKNEDNKCSAAIVSNIPTIDLYKEKKKLIQYVSHDYILQEDNKTDFIRLVLNKQEIMQKFFVPLNYSTQAQIEWFSGYSDGDGNTIKTNGKTSGIQIASIEQTFLQEIQLMLQILGVNSNISLVYEQRQRLMPNGKGGQKLYDQTALYRINIDVDGLKKLISLGYKPHRLKLNQVNDLQEGQLRFNQVKHIQNNYKIDQTFCCHEEKRNTVVFNGVLTGNCSEINIYSDSLQYGVCNLSSLCLGRYVEYDTKDQPYVNYEKLDRYTRMLVQNLNIVIDTSYYPVEKARISNFNYRPIGIGVQGLADLFIKMRLPFESDDALQLQDKIFAQIYYSSLDESCNLVKTYNLYKDYHKSLLSQGILQFDLWKQHQHSDVDSKLNLQPHPDFDWDKLRKRVINEGAVNSLLLAQMPTASTSVIMQQTESIEPITAPVYCRKTNTGEFWNINKYLVSDLKKLNLWNQEMFYLIYSSKSIQQIDSIPQQIKSLYKSIWDIKQQRILFMSANRGKYICQSQSQNLYLSQPTLLQMQKSIFYAWSLGLKTGCYYLRTQPAHYVQKFTIQNQDKELSSPRLATMSRSNSEEKQQNIQDSSSGENQIKHDNSSLTDMGFCKIGDKDCVNCGS